MNCKSGIYGNHWLYTKTIWGCVIILVQWIILCLKGHGLDVIQSMFFNKLSVTMINSDCVS